MFVLYFYALRTDLFSELKKTALRIILYRIIHSKINHWLHKKISFPGTKFPEEILKYLKNESNIFSVDRGVNQKGRKTVSMQKVH